MTNFASQLKSEIQRIARKELRAETLALKKSSSVYRSEIASLKRRIASLEASIKKLTKTAGSLAKTVAAEKEPTEAGAALRWRASGFAALRNKLDLSAADMGKLLGVSSATVYNWENGKSHPRASQLPAVASVRKLGKREAAAKLAALK